MSRPAPFPGTVTGGPLTPRRTTANAAGRRSPRMRQRLLQAVPPLTAVLLVGAVWEAVYVAAWWPPYVLPSPGEVMVRFAGQWGEPKFWAAVLATVVRACIGFASALLVGTAVGLLVSWSRLLRGAIGSLITGMQTMPSIAWFPFAILLFGLSEQAIGFVVVLGAAPSIANGLISGIDDVPTPLLRTAQALGARGVGLYRYIIFPAALPAYVSGLKQGWAFAWRSLMAGELLVIIASRPSLGVQLQYFREFADTAGLISTMLVILLLGMMVDGAFTSVTRRVQARRGVGVNRSWARG